MRPSPVRLYPRHILGLASVVGLALAAGCNGQGALYARDKTALLGSGGGAGTGGTGPGVGGDMGGTGDIAGSGGATGGQAGGATGGIGGSGGHGGAGTGGSGAGTGGTLATGGTGGGTGGTPGKALGTACGGPTECASGFCADKVCCDSACTATCLSCVNSKNGGQGDGNCRAVPAGFDYDGDCPTTPASMCGSTGQGCNGAGQCKKWAAGTSCDATVTCDASSSSVIPGKICNGAGTCQAAPGQSCNGFLCSVVGGTATCGTSCTDDSACVTGGFCSAHACIGVPNLAGNGDLETGLTSGWANENGAGTVQVSSLAVGGFAHTGQYSLQQTGRGIYYSAPGYTFPTGLGKYIISVWTRQNEDFNFPGVLQVRLNCASTSSYISVLPAFSQNMPMGTWTQMMGTIDTTNMATVTGLQPDCLPPTGLVRSAFVYLNQPDYSPSSGNAAPVPNALPDLFMDDLVIQVPDGHNLISNSGFESGFIDGWTASATPSLLQPTAKQKNGGTNSLWLSNRAATTTGIQVALPTGAARYKVTFNALHTGTMPHPLVILPSYTCIGGTQKFGSQITLPGTGGNPGLVDGNMWVPLTGTVTLPPANEAAGCVLSQAALTLQQGDTGPCSTVECPDLYLDDASVTIPTN